MLQLSLTSAMGASGNATMFIDYQSESIGFMVISDDDNHQYDFTIDKEEWDQFKKFIETAMERDTPTNNQ